MELVHDPHRQTGLERGHDARGEKHGAGAGAARAARAHAEHAGHAAAQPPARAAAFRCLKQ